MVVVVMAVVMMTMMWNGDDGKCKYDGSDVCHNDDGDDDDDGE